jgi:hypothetical protein
MFITSISDKGKSFLVEYQHFPQPLLLKITEEMYSDDDNSSSSNDEVLADGYSLSNVCPLFYIHLKFLSFIYTSFGI